MRRVDSTGDFPNQDWQAYSDGFGDLEGSFWLGLRHMHQLTTRRRYVLRVELEDFDDAERYAEYSTFVVGPASQNYQLTVTGYSGDAGDSLAKSNGNAFSTKQVDNDKSSGHCAQARNAAWWYRACTHSQLTGEYLRGPHSKAGQGIYWHHWRGTNYSYKRVKMMIRPHHF
jgi:hypothetical protein